VYLNQNATSHSDNSTHEDTEKDPAPIPKVVLTSPNDEKTLQTEGDQFKTQENDGQLATSPSIPVTLEVPTRKRIRRSPRLAHQFEGAGVDGDNATETDHPSYWSMASDLSSVSDSSTTLSYRTASSDLTRDNSPTSGGGLPVKDTMTLFRSMKDELLQGMKQLLEDRMSKMEQKFESSQRKLETRVDDVEKRLQEMHGENGLLPTVTEDTRVNEVPSAAVLDTVKEDSEEDEDGEVKGKISTTSSSQFQNLQVAMTSQRRYTDSEAMEVTQHKKIQKRRQDFAKRKSQSLHYSQLFQKPCNQQVIMWLTQRVTNWKFLGRWLGLPENVLSRIITDNQKSDREQCYQMFLRWKESDPENYTYPVLGDALQRESQVLYNEFVDEVRQVATTTFTTT
jgi:hypothetical protein